MIMTHEEKVKFLSELKPGDEVYQESGNYMGADITPVTVKRVTANYLIIESDSGKEKKYNRKTGCDTGRDYSRSGFGSIRYNLLPRNEETDKRHLIQRGKLVLLCTRNTFDNINLSKLCDEDIVALVQCTKQLNEKLAEIRKRGVKG